MKESSHDHIALSTLANHRLAPAAVHPRDQGRLSPIARLVLCSCSKRAALGLGWSRMSFVSTSERSERVNTKQTEPSGFEAASQA